MALANRRVVGKAYSWCGARIDRDRNGIASAIGTCSYILC
ncbi:hypothetical protein [Flavobacterium sp. 28YEA47A]